MNSRCRYLQGSSCIVIYGPTPHESVTKLPPSATSHERIKGVNPSIHRRVCFLLVPEFSMLAFSAALEPLRMANRLADRQLYSWEILAETMDPVLASSGLSITPDRTVEDVRDPDMVLVCGGLDIHRNTRKQHLSFYNAQCRESYRRVRYAPAATRWRKRVCSTAIDAPFTGKISPACEKPSQRS